MNERCFFCDSYHHIKLVCPSPKKQMMLIVCEKARVDDLQSLDKKTLNLLYGILLDRLSKTNSINDVEIDKPQNKKFKKWTRDDLKNACESIMIFLKEKENKCPICFDCMDGKHCVTPLCGHTICTDCAIKLRASSQRADYRNNVNCCLCREPIAFM